MQWEDECRQAARRAAVEELQRLYEAHDRHLAAGKQMCPRCRVRLHLLGVRARYLTCCAGTLRFARHVYYCRQCQHTHAPLDAALDIAGRQESKLLRQLCVRLGAAVPYAEGARLLTDLTGVVVSASTIEELSVAAGRAVLAQQRGRATPEPPPHGPLYIGMDGVTMRVRATQPWRVARVGTVFTTCPGPDGPCVQDKEYVAELASAEQFGRTLWETAVRWGVMDARRVVILADGAKENWAWAQMYVPGAVEILDFYHACEHLRAVRDACFRATDPAGHAWLERHCHALKHGHWTDVMAAMTALHPRGAAARHVLQREQGYFCTNRQRMRYALFQRQGYYIGSGVVESGCKQVGTRRMKAPGARWDEDRGAAILALRCAYLSRRDLLDRYA